MATWTSVEVLDEAGHKLISFCAVGVLIYYLDASNGQQYEYNTVADTLTRIDSGNFGGGTKLAVFRDKVYNVRAIGADYFVQRYNGGGLGDFTQVADITVPDFGLGGPEPNLYAHGSYLVAVNVGEWDGTNNYVAIHTTDGTNWVASTVPVIIRAHSATLGWDEKNMTVQFPTALGIVETFIVGGPGDGGGTGGQQILKFNAGVWSVLNASPAGTEWARNSGPGIWWANYQVGDRWTKDFSSFTTPAGSVTACYTFDLPATSWGVDDSFPSTSREIYRFDGTAWVLLDTKTIGGATWYGADRATFIRVGDDIYMVGEISTTVTWLFKRDEPLPSGRFYYGQGNLVRRSDAPILSTNPGGLALMGKTLLAGSSVNSEVMVGYANEPTYEEWVDYTGTLSKTAPIKSFSATPWGDSEDLEASEDVTEGGGFQGGTGGRCS